MNLLTRLFGRKSRLEHQLRTFAEQQYSGHAIIDDRNHALLVKRQLEEALKGKAKAEREVARARQVVRFTPGKEFVAVFPFHAGDYARFMDLMGWMRELEGGKIGGRALLVGPCSMNRGMLSEAADCCPFDLVEYIWTPFDLPKEGWPTGTCWSFLTAANYCREQHLDFWLNEPDCIPLKAGWFEAIRAEYRQCGLPYMGFIEPATADYPEHLTGNAAYHHGVFHHFRADQLGKAWDIAMADVLTPLAHRTRLFHQEFGPLDHPPTFHTVDDLRRIPPDAMVFHRNKDGSLIRVLRERRKLEAGSKGQGVEAGGAE